MDHLSTKGLGPNTDCLRVGDGDDFIGNLWKVHSRVKEEGYVQVSSPASEVETDGMRY